MRLIDADALKEYIDAQKGRPFIGCTIGEALKMMVDEQPTIEERKTGKWIIRDNPLIGWFRVSCSECGEDVTSNIPTIGFFPYCKPLWDYCPYCGAEMEEEQDG